MKVLLMIGLFFLMTCAENSMSAATTQPAQKIRIAVCQILCIDGDRSGNFARIERALQQAQDAQAQIACFPESVILGWENPEAHKLAEPIPGKDSDRICKLAKQFKMMIAIGLDEKDGDRLYDSAILVDLDGKILLKHRKINVLPELMDPPYSTGKVQDISAADTRFGRIGMMVCADTFTDKHIEKMDSLHPNLVLVPYGWAAPNHKWPKHAKQLETLVCSIAKKWNCPVVGTDLVGVISQGPWRGQTYGGASIVASTEGKPMVILADRDVEVKTLEVFLTKTRDEQKANARR